jgi:hypothetical protein
MAINRTMMGTRWVQGAAAMGGFRQANSLGKEVGVASTERVFRETASTKEMTHPV